MTGLQSALLCADDVEDYVSIHSGEAQGPGRGRESLRCWTELQSVVAEDLHAIVKHTDL